MRPAIHTRPQTVVSRRHPAYTPTLHRPVYHVVLYNSCYYIGLLGLEQLNSVTSCELTALLSCNIDVKMWKTTPRFTSGSGAKAKFNHFYMVIPCPCLSSLTVDVHQRVRELSCEHTDRRTDMQTEVYR